MCTHDVNYALRDITRYEASCIVSNNNLGGSIILLVKSNDIACVKLAREMKASQIRPTIQTDNYLHRCRSSSLYIVMGHPCVPSGVTIGQ